MQNQVRILGCAIQLVNKTPTSYRINQLMKEHQFVHVDPCFTKDATTETKRIQVHTVKVRALLSSANRISEFQFHSQNAQGYSFKWMFAIRSNKLRRLDTNQQPFAFIFSFPLLYFIPRRGKKKRYDVACKTVARTAGTKRCKLYLTFPSGNYFRIILLLII